MRTAFIGCAFTMLLTAQERAAYQPREFFRHPAALCAALQTDGVPAGVWQPINSAAPPTRSPYTCESREARTVVAGTSLLYRVSGDTASRADLISIAVTVHRPPAMQAAEQEFEQHIRTLFKVIDRPQPHGLLESVKGHRYFLSRQPFGLVWFNLILPDREKATDQILWFRLRE